MAMTSAAPLRLQSLLGRAPLVMGIVNVTPDSFHDGGRFSSTEAAVAQGLRLAAEGADLLDIGGESTRPGSEGVSEAEEQARVLPVLSALAAKTQLPLSIDTSKASVARAALAAGARLINDVSALTADPAMLPFAAASGAPVILMHMKGRPRDMQMDPRYGDVVEEVRAYLKERLEAFAAAGGDPAQALVDPGLGFGKNLAHNLALLKGTGRLAQLAPVVVGASRKSFLGRLAAGERPSGPALDAGALPPSQARLAASLSAALCAASAGAAVLRVHDVAETRQALAVWKELR